MRARLNEAEEIHTLLEKQRKRVTDDCLRLRAALDSRKGRWLDRVHDRGFGADYRHKKGAGRMKVKNDGLRFYMLVSSDGNTKYAYGPDWVWVALFTGDIRGYDTPEEAKAAWERGEWSSEV